MLAIAVPATTMPAYAQEPSQAPAEANSPGAPPQEAPSQGISPQGARPPAPAAEAQRPEAGPSATARFALVTAKVNLRSRPGTDAEILATISAGSRVEVTDCIEWCMVTWKGRSGFVIARNLGIQGTRQGRAPRRAPGYAGAPPAAEPSGLYEAEPPMVNHLPGGETSGDSDRDKTVTRGGARPEKR
jgi:uncharacterized protein YraI